jgi:hypothetical protein
MDMQKHLMYLAGLVVRDLKSPKLRGVTAKWREKDHTACLTFYFDGEATEEELEDASCACTEIISHFFDGLLEENYLRWDYPKPLPDRHLLAYERVEKPSKNSWFSDLLAWARNLFVMMCSFTTYPILD